MKPVKVVIRPYPGVKSFIEITKSIKSTQDYIAQQSPKFKTTKEYHTWAINAMTQKLLRISYTLDTEKVEK